MFFEHDTKLNSSLIKVLRNSLFLTSPSSESQGSQGFVDSTEDTFKFLGLSEHIPVALCIKSKDLNTVFSNRYAAINYPCSKSDPSYKKNSLSSIISNFDLIKSHDIQAFKSGFSEHEEVFESQSNEKRYFTTKRIRFKCNNSTPLLLIIAADLTHIKTREKTRKNPNRTTKKKTDEHTEFSINSFLNNINHEIRTPINGIIGMLKQAYSLSESCEQKRVLRIANQSANSLLNIVNNILDFNALNSGQIELIEKEYDLIELFNKISEIYSTEALKKGLDFYATFNKIPSQKYILDGEKLKKIISNLLSNALKFSNRGKIVCFIKLNDEYYHDSTLEVNIIDEGIGINIDNLKSVFQPFTQEDYSSSRPFEGSGLGLSIAKKLSDQMGGSIIVDSAKSIGTTFSLTIPIKTSHSPSLYKESFQKISQEKKKILIFDQDRFSNNTITKLAHHESIQISTTHSIKNHGSSFDISSYHLIIINDLFYYKHKDTFDQLLSVSAQISPTPNFKVLLSSKQIKHQNEGLPSSLFNLIVNKPFTPLLLSNIINQYIHHLTFVDSTISSENHKNNQSKQATNRTSNSHILIVDDNAVNREVVSYILQDEGFSFDMACNGREAINKLQSSTQFSAVLMDCQMPIMDGYEATQSIRQGAAGKKYQKIPIIALTANAIAENEERCYRSGMNKYLTKPINEAKLVQTINSITARGS